jgi:tetratricopeptide (TPR) repeat protein
MKRRIFMTGIILAVLVGGSSQTPAQDETTLTAQYDAARQAKNWSSAESLARQLIAKHPQDWTSHRRLAEVQFSAAQYSDALASFQTAIKFASVLSSTRARDAVGEMLTAEGDVYLKLNKKAEAINAFVEAAPLSTNPGIAYFNICVVAYNQGAIERALSACDKAIEVDPRKADAYFLKGSLLFGNGAVKPSGKYSVPEGTADALEKYLALAPTGGHAEEVKQMLQTIE